MYTWVVFTVLLFTAHIYAQGPAPTSGGKDDYELTGNFVSTDNNNLIACIQDSGQLWVFDSGIGGATTSVGPLPDCEARRSTDGGCGLLLRTSDTEGVPDSPPCFDVMSQGNPRDSWGFSTDISGTRFIARSDLYFTPFADSAWENFDVEDHINVTSSGGGIAGPGNHFISTSIVVNPTNVDEAIATVIHDCYTVTGITQTILCDVTVTNDLAIAINDVRYRKSTDYDPRGGVINTITVLNNRALGVGIGLLISPYSYEQSDTSFPFDPRPCLAPEGCGPDQLGVSFEIPIGTLEAGQTYAFQMYYGGADNRADLISSTIGLFAVPANIAFYGETFSRSVVPATTDDPSYEICPSANSADPCFNADSWLLGIGYPFTDCGCWSLWECPDVSPPLSPIRCSGPTEYYQSPASPSAGTPTSYLIHSTTTSQAYRFENPGCTLTGNIGDCAPTTVDIRDDNVVRWYCRTPARQCVTFDPISAANITYNIDIGPAAGIDCTRCLGDDCKVEEGTEEPVTRDCYAYWTCPATTAPTFPTLCGSSPVSVIGPNLDTSATTYGFIVHSDTPGQLYTFPAGCVQNFLFGAACDATTAGPLREDWTLRYPCGSSTGICTTADNNPATGNYYNVDIGPAPTIDCTTCLDADSCTVPKSDVPDAPCAGYIFP